ncbi:hypothetical protein OPQ81_008320 [Rhizoctonia solani]|nr:hypothetical protein OPQ81_008320 [Rhizoctonia solani]
MNFGTVNATGPPFGLGPDPSGNPNINRVIGVDIIFTCVGFEPIHRSFFRSEWNSIHLGREPTDISGVANAFLRSDVVPPVMSRKHAEIMLAGDTPQVVDIGSYHGTYFRSNGQRLIANRPYQLTDGLILEFGKSVTKDDKAHEPLLATIKFIRESDRGRFRIASREQSSLLPPSSPPRRYSIPSDSEGEDEVSDEDEMESHSDVFEYNPHQHIDLTGMSDDSKSSQDTEDEGIEYVGFGFSRNAYDEESISGSDMSESEFEEETGKVVAQPGGMDGPDMFNGIGPTPSGGVTVVAPAPAPISANPSVHGIETLSCLEYSEVGVGFYNPLPIPDFARHHMEVTSRSQGLDFGYGSIVEVRSGSGMEPQQDITQVSRGHEGSHIQAHLEPEPSQNIHESNMQISHVVQPSEEVRALKAELAVAQDKIAELKQSLVEREAAVVAAAEPPVVEDVPARIANIENMMTQLTTVGDGEMCEHRTAVLDMLAQLSSGIEALRVRVGYEAPKSPHQGQKRKRADEEEEDDVESSRAQPPAQMVTATPSAAPSPTKRSRMINPAVSALVTGAAVWGALASGYL